MTTTTIDEVGELITTLLATPADQTTACRGWTAHELVAHLAAGAAEEADLIEAHLASAPERPTRHFETREPPFRALADNALRDRLVEEAARLAVALDRLSGDELDGVTFTGRRMTAADFAMHSRSESALHRWDLVGRDDIGWAMLGQPELTNHGISVLNAMSTLPEAPLNRLRRDRGGNADATRVVLRSAPHDDVVVTVDGEVVTIAPAPLGESPPSLTLDPARLLMLWGRRDPTAAIDLEAVGADRPPATALLGW